MLLVERTKFFLLRNRRKFYLILGIIGCFSVFHFLFFSALGKRIISKLVSDPNILTLGGTLLGAVIGGACSIFASVAVNNSQRKAERNRRIKNDIYKPLYDELYENHNRIIKENPYPTRIILADEHQSIKPCPSYSVWKKIKGDSRYLDVPFKEAKQLDRLVGKANDYITAVKQASAAIELNLKEAMRSESVCDTTFADVGLILMSAVAKGDKDVLLSDDMLLLHTTEEKKINIQRLFTQKCETDSSIISLRKAYNEWQYVEEEVILLLSMLIRKINAKYDC